MFPPLDYELARAKGRDLDLRLERSAGARRLDLAAASASDHRASLEWAFEGRNNRDLAVGVGSVAFRVIDGCQEEVWREGSGALRV